jgi:hypothetical protein
MKFEDVLDGVYVFGVKGHSDKQTFYIFSKDSTSGTQNIKVKVENDILKIYIVRGKNKIDSENQIFYLAKTYQSPVKYEVYRNNNLEKSERIGYGIE